MRTKNFIIVGLVALIIIGVILITTSTAPGNYDGFAQCLTEKGVKMYGAYWCPHCLSQKALFGNSWKYVDYIECDAKGPNPRVQMCLDAGIRGYPTWVVRGQKLVGEQTLQALSVISGCPLTQNAENKK